MIRIQELKVTRNQSHNATRDPDIQAVISHTTNGQKSARAIY